MSSGAPPAYPGQTVGAAPTQMYNVVVPQGVTPGQTFQAVANGVVMNVVCPDGVHAGMEVQIPGPPQAAGAAPMAAATGTAVGYGYAPEPMRYGQAPYAAGPQYDSRPMVEETVISPLGWFICIVGARTARAAPRRAAPELGASRARAPSCPDPHRRAARAHHPLVAARPQAASSARRATSSASACRRGDWSRGLDRACTPGANAPALHCRAGPAVARSASV